MHGNLAGFPESTDRFFLSPRHTETKELMDLSQREDVGLWTVDGEYYGIKGP